MPGTIAGAVPRDRQHGARPCPRPPRATVPHAPRRTRHPAVHGHGSRAPANPAFPHLFSPITIGDVTIRNRILSSGHDTVMAEGGLVSDRLIAYQEARARGGAGLIVIQVAGVHPTARYTATELTADTDASIPGFARLAEAIHRHGAKVFGQLFHGGREIMETEDGTLAIALGAERGSHRALPRDAARDDHDAHRGDRGRLRRVRGAAGGCRPRRGGGGRLARLPAGAVPQPAHQPARRTRGVATSPGGCGSFARPWPPAARRPGQASSWACGSPWAR